MNLININTTLKIPPPAEAGKKIKKKKFYVSVARRTCSKRHCCCEAAFAVTGFNRKGLCCRLSSHRCLE